jgi:hypothetical protein
VRRGLVLAEPGSQLAEQLDRFNIAKVRVLYVDLGDAGAFQGT